MFYYPRGIEETHNKGIIDPQVDTDIPVDIVKTLRDPHLRGVTGHFSFGIHLHISSPSKYVTIVRNPIDRLLSLYFHILKWPRSPQQKRIVQAGLSLEQFVTMSGYTQADNGQARRLAGVEPEFGECDEDLLTLAKTNISRHFATVGLVERFDESIVLIKRAFGWPLELRYWKRLVNKERPPADGIAPRTLEILRERNWLDLRLYEYACEVFDRQVADAGSDFQEEAERVKCQNVPKAEWFPRADDCRS
jgi:hypothetical protein